MKWLERTAQGFTPGNGDKPSRSERVAEGVPTRRSLSPQKSALGRFIRRIFCSRYEQTRGGHGYVLTGRLPVQGDRVRDAYPGLKPGLFS
jgi:hypothetical protein